MGFQQQKEKQLEMKDNSSIGKWDEKIAELCEKINNKKEYYTTSSCAGRIVLIKKADKKQEGLFLFRAHGKVSFSEIKRELEKVKENNEIIYFRQEPCILHVACKTLGDAQILLDKAKFVGWKNSGVMASNKRVVLEMRSTEHIELPIIKNKKILVSDEFLKILVDEANEKLEKTWKKIQNLERMI